MTAEPILQVALPAPLRRSFDYLPPQSAFAPPLAAGLRVSVPFGKRELIGVITGIGEHSGVSPQKLKRARRIIDEQPLIPQSLLELYQWCAHYYQHPIGDVFATALPTLLRKGVTDLQRTELVYLVTETGKCSLDQLRRRAPKQAELMVLANQHPKGIGDHALQTLGLKGSPLKALLDKGYLRVQHLQPSHHQHAAEILAEAPLTLNKDQQQAVRAVAGKLGQFSCYLLEGVTGSGKTEVYLQLIEQVLKQGNSTLVLVPEIGLTPQTVARFKRRFNAPILLLHSGLSDQQRAHDWLRAAQEDACIVIGTRSSVFAPIRKLGMIIVDEEHDLSFKQQDGLRYSARDVAVMRAHHSNIPIILGSATPSLESLHNVDSGRYRHLVLPERAGTAEPPEFELLDIRSRPLQSGFSQPLISAIAAELNSGNQVLVFLNRRGFAPALLCHECGWSASCRRCDARLTLHLKPHQLRCHHCDSQQRVPVECPECGHVELNPIGVGTERTEQEIEKLFPSHTVIRIDRDTTRSKTAMQGMVDRIKTGKPCILIGTQMLAKGHHFPGVTLVAVLEADSGLFSSDFRGLERMGQLIIQVAGRAGRASKRGRVMIQTHQGDHPLLQCLIGKGYPEFARLLLTERRQAELPPYAHTVLFRAEAVNERTPFEFLARVKELSQQLISTYQLQDIQVLGPIPAIMYKKAGRYRAQLMLKCRDRKPIHRLVTPLTLQLESQGESRKVRWSIDVDPMEFL